MTAPYAAIAAPSRAFHASRSSRMTTAWWPECVSRLWADEAGQTTRISPDGSEKRAPPKNWGGIGNGHMIKLGDDPEAYSPWDENFEGDFGEADGQFPRIVRLFESMPWEDRRGLPSVRDRFVAQPIDDACFTTAIECLVSLAVRSPMTREHAVALAEHHRGPLPGRKRNAIIGLNLRQRMSMVRSAIGGRGKLALLHSPDREFIFGDGFNHNLTSRGTRRIHPRSSHR